MWTVIDAARNGDPRPPNVDNPYAGNETTNVDSSTSAPPPPSCLPRPPDSCVTNGHAYDKFTASNKTKGRAVSAEFGTNLKDLPLFQGLSKGLMPVEGHRFPWPHEDLHVQSDDEGLSIPHEKDYVMLPDNSMANRITNFHNFCKQLPDVMCNYCSITLYPEDVKWVALGEDDIANSCRASAANAHVRGIDAYTSRSKRVKGGRNEYAFCGSHASKTGREEWVFDDIGDIPPVLACLTPAERRATALLRMRCCMFKGGGGVGSGYTILKGAAEYVPADFDGAVGQIAIDVSKAKDIRPEKVDAALKWLLPNNPLVAKYLTVWDTHQDRLTQPSAEEDQTDLPAGFPTMSCPAGRMGDTCSDVQGLVMPSGSKPVPQTHDRDLDLDQIVAGDVLTRESAECSSPDSGGSKRAFPVYYDPYTGLAKDAQHCMEMLRSVHLFPFGRGGYTRGLHGERQLPAMDHTRYIKMRLHQVDPRFRDPSETYTFAAVDDKIKQQLHRSNTRSTTYTNVADAGEGFMQRLDESTKRERNAENRDALERVCRDIGIPSHSGDDCAQCRRTTTSAGGRIACKRCGHLVATGTTSCPHCDGVPTKQARAGEDGKLPMLEGLEKISQSLPSQIPGSSAFWAMKLKELLAMTDVLGQPHLFITKTCYEGSDDIRALLDFCGCPHVEWPKHQVGITRHWRRNIMEWLKR